MKIAAAQIDCQPGNIPANLEKIKTFMHRAKEGGAELVIFPEMVDTGYEMVAIRISSLRWETGPFLQLRQAAINLDIHLICGISEKVGATIYNTQAVIDKSGKLLGKYRKTHLADYLPLYEGRCITPGSSLETVQFAGLTLGLMICYDLRFPELSRALTRKGAQLLVLSSAWPFPRQRHWQTLIAARAIENQVYLAAANRVGTDGKITFCGTSSIIDPYGVTLSSAGEDSEELIFAEISEDKIKQVREKLPVLKHRRNDLY